MRSYNQRKKNNIIIGTLCAVVLLITVGYAAFSSVLNIKGTSSISSNWDIEITNIRGGNPWGGDAYDIKEPTYTPTTATFNTGLKTPGTMRVYEVEVTNKGTLTGLVTIASLTAGENNALDGIVWASDGKEIDDNWNALEVPAVTNQINSFRFGKVDYSGLEFKILPGEKHYLYILVEYTNVTSQPDNLSTNINLELTYEQESMRSSEGGQIKNDYTGIVYSYNVMYTPNDISDWDSWARKNYIYPGDSLEKIKGYTEDYNSLGSNFFLKHIMNNGSVESSEVCFIKDGIHCLKPNEYETSKASLLSIFGEEACSVDDDGVNCGYDYFHLYAWDDGSISANDYVKGVGYHLECLVDYDGIAYCYI